MVEKDVSLFQIILIILKKKYFFLANFCIVFIAAIFISLSLTKEYKSTVVFIPPGQSSSGLLSMLGNNFSPELLDGSDLSKRQYIALLRSRELREQLINKFDLIHVYKLEKTVPKTDLTLKALDKNILIKENEEGGLGITDIISVDVSVIDKNPQRAADMANEIFRLLENKTIQISQREANLKIEFLNQQISSNDTLLASARKELYEFQKRNKMYDVSSQAKLTVQVMSQLEAKKMALEIQRSYLQQSFSSQNIELNSINDRIAVYNNKINELEQNTNNTITPGLLKTLELSNKYADLFKEEETYFQLNVLLRQQLEMAKIKQQKSYSGISLVDSARPAEWKFRPKRAVVVLALTFFYMISLFILVSLKEYYKYLRSKHPEKTAQFFKALW